MNWIATVIGIIILIPLAIFILRRFAVIIALALGVVGVLSFLAKQYIGGGILLIIYEIFSSSILFMPWIFAPRTYS